MKCQLELIYPTPLPPTGCGTRSVFKWSTPDFSPDFFPLLGCCGKNRMTHAFSRTKGISPK